MPEQNDKSLWDKIAEFKDKAAEFMRVFTRMEELKSVAYADPAAKLRYDQQMSLASSIMNKIRYVTGLIDSAYGSITNLFGMDTVNQEIHDNNLGLAFVPLAVIAGATVAIVAWTSKAVIQLKELEAVRELMAEGATAEQAYKLVRQENGGLLGPLLGPIGDAAGWLILLGGAFWLFNRMRR